MSEHTWRGDWITRIYERVHERGFDSVTALAETRPTATLMELAADLGDDVAAIQLEGILYSEAERAGTFDRFARGLMARCMRHWMPVGWNAGKDVAMERADVYASWSACVRGFMDKPKRKAIWETLKAADIPTGWLPSGPDDPIIERAFAGVRIDAPVTEG